MSTQRTVITISNDDKSWIEAYSKSHNISMAEVIRKGIAELKEKEAEGLYKTLVNETKGVWEKGDGLKYQKQIRAEWDERDAE